MTVRIHNRPCEPIGPGDPPPGSQTARDQGCMCDPLANNCGDWPPRVDRAGTDLWEIAFHCPVHDPKERDQERRLWDHQME